MAMDIDAEGDLLQSPTYVFTPSYYVRTKHTIETTNILLLSANNLITTHYRPSI